MPVGILIYSPYCPKCEVFRYGSLEVYRGTEMFEVEGLGEGVESAFEIVRAVCTPVGIPITEIDISQIYGWEEDEFHTLYIPEISEKGFRRRFIPRTTHREWIPQWIGRSSIELPGFIIKSPIARDRYINIEIVLEKPSILMDWQAARQVLRTMARVAIEEKLILMKMNTYENRELLFNRLFPVNETGKVDVERWIRGFILLKHLKRRRVVD
jgi:hypothetical protein